MRARLSILFLALLAAAPLLGFLPRILGPRTREPLDRRPTWAQLVVVTCDRLPEDLDLTGSGFATLERRAARAALRAPDLADLSAAAAGLWTGRRCAPVDLASAGGAGPWSLAAAAQRTGASSAALLEAPLVTEAGIAGFDRLLEDAALGPERLLALAGEHLAQHAGQRSVLWLHLAEAGGRAARLEALLEGLHGALEASGGRWDTLLLVTALTGEPGSEIPLWAELPNALYAGRRGRGAADPADVAGVLLQVLRLPAPDVTRGETPVESTADLAILLQGGTLVPAPAR